MPTIASLAVCSGNIIILRSMLFCYIIIYTRANAISQINRRVLTIHCYVQLQMYYELFIQCPCPVQIINVF